jgi:hypothetical protein
MKLNNAEHSMYRRDKKHGYTKMPPVIQQGQKFFIDSA